MRHLIASLMVAGAFSASILAVPDPAAGQTAIKACSLLSKELVAKYWPGDKRAFEVLRPEEEPLGATGSSCDYGTIGLQVDPFTPQQVDQIAKEKSTEWSAVPGLGDSAYFRNNRNRFAELLVRTGAHTFTIQMGVPMGKTADAIKPDTIAVAREILPRLQ
jgi:hypothetical protein